MEFWYYTVNGHRLRVRANKRRKPKCVQIGDKAWQIGKAIVIACGDRLELLNS